MNIDIVPAQMKALSNWVFWRTVQRDGRPTKVPFNPQTGQMAKSNDPSTWGDFETVLSYIDKSDGPGFMFGDSGIKGIDLDSALVDGELEPWAREIVTTARSFTEISPSGNGLHIFYTGKLNLPAIGAGTAGHGPHAEYYETGRYFTFTGNVDPEFSFPLRELSGDEEKTVHKMISDTHKRSLQTGSRHPTIVSDAGYHLSAGHPLEVAIASALAINKTFEEPLPDAEVDKHVKGIYGRYEAGKPKKLCQDDISQSVLEKIGRKNIISCNSGLHRYNEAVGVWEVVSTSEYQGIVQRLLKDIVPAEQYTNTLVRNIADLTRREVERGNFQFDNHEDDSIAVENGIVRFAGGSWKLYPHSRDEYRTIKAPVPFSPTANCPMFERFLRACCINNKAYHYADIDIIE